jgi:hypothetical protein
MVLYSADLPEPIPHDYLDDLESFFYILTCIVYTYDCHGVSHPQNELLKRWQTITGSTAAVAKEAFLTRGRFIPNPIASRWPKAFLDVFFGLRVFLFPLVQEKVSVMEMEPEEVLESLKWFASNAEQHYDEVLKIFDAGIEALEKIDDGCPACPQAAPTDADPSSVHLPTQQNTAARKRPREEEPDSLPAAKRPHLSP